MSAIVDFPRDGIEAFLGVNSLSLVALVLNLEIEGLEICPVAACRFGLALAVAACQGLAGVGQLRLGVGVTAPMLSCVEAFGGCERCANAGDDGEDCEDLHFESLKWAVRI